MLVGEKKGTDPRTLPAEVAKAVVGLSQAPDFRVFAEYLDTLCEMYTSNAIWTPDNADLARGRAQAINGLLMALASAPQVAARPIKETR